ncbi:MAG TPA: universal stress protein [Jatrophihabitans sp.]|nr:universal stress protein [Jatrophihabitans sp.]
MSEVADTDEVLVGVDGSAQSVLALQWAASLAESLDCALHVITIWDLPVFIGDAGAYVPDNWDPEGNARRAVEAAVDDVFTDGRPTGLRVSVCRGNAARTLIDASGSARMLVLGSRGHGGFAGLLLGSVSANCAERAHCPVLVVHGDTPPPTQRRGEQ